MSMFQQKHMYGWSISTVLNRNIWQYKQIMWIFITDKTQERDQMCFQSYNRVFQYFIFQVFWRFIFSLLWLLAVQCDSTWVGFWCWRGFGHVAWLHHSHWCRPQRGLISWAPRPPSSLYPLNWNSTLSLRGACLCVTALVTKTFRECC